GIRRPRRPASGTGWMRAGKYRRDLDVAPATSFCSVVEIRSCFSGVRNSRRSFDFVRLTPDFAQDDNRGRRSGRFRERQNERGSSAVGSAEIGATEFLAEIQPIQLDDAAHFVEPGAHAFSDPVAQSFLARRPPRRRQGAAYAARRLILEIR